MEHEDTTGQSQEPDALVRFAREATNVLTRPLPSPASTNDVLSKLVSATARDISLVTDEGKKRGFRSDHNQGTILLPTEPAAKDFMTVAYDLDTDDAFRGERNGLLECKRGLDMLEIRWLTAQIHRSTRDLLKSANLLQGWFEWNSAEDVGIAPVPIQVIADLTDEEQEKIRNYLLEHMMLNPEEYEVRHAMGLHAIAGATLHQRLMKKHEHRNSFPHSVDTAMELLLRSKIARQKTLLSLQGFKHIPQVKLSEAIVRQGYRSFLDMEGMTEYDVWATWKETLVEKIEDFTGKLTKTPEGALLYALDFLESNIQPQQEQADEEEGDLSADPQERLMMDDATSGVIADIANKMVEMMPTVESQQTLDPKMLEEIGKSMMEFGERLRRETNEQLKNPDVYLMGNDKEVWRKANDYLKTHEPEPRRKLTEIIDCAGYRTKIETLRSQSQWTALAAKERELAQRVFSEVIQIPYDSDSDRLYERTSYKSGTPAYALEHRKLTCFTGPWLMASLLLEAGIPYHQIFYCNLNEAPGERAASHGALLLHLSDGSAMFLDYGYKQCGRPFALSMLTEKKQAAELKRLLEMSRAASELKEKFCGYPAHVQINRDLSKTLKICNDAHIMPLDQGFAGISLLHAGIALEEEGKKDEAVAAYEMGLVSYPNSPDLLCRLAIIALQDKELDRAELLLNLSLNAYGGHIQSWYYAGVLAVERGDEKAALTHFRRVVEDKRTLWGDDRFKVNARRYCEQADSIHAQREKIQFLNTLSELAEVIDNIE